MATTETKPTSFWIDPVLKEVLDKIVDTDPRYSNRSALIRNWIWEKIMELGYFDESKIKKAVEAGVH